MTKQQLTDELLHNPLNFDNLMLEDLLDSGFGFMDIRECIRRIYDLSEQELTRTSNANTGMAGMLNQLSTSNRKKRFNRKIKKLKEGVQYKIIYAEGDSWFQFPLFINDIIDWLSKKEGYIVYSDAYGGDWITNIIYESQYVSALSVLKPSFFLISGGGNDLVGNNRLAMMVQKNYSNRKYVEAANIIDPQLSETQKEMIIAAQDHITKEFYAFLWAIKAQYLLLFRNLYATGSTQGDVITITQGYDYAIPGLKPDRPVFHPGQVFINKSLDNGCWLERPLRIRGIFDEYLQRSLVFTFIYEFNRIFISLATEHGFKNVYHVDSRGLAVSRSNWFDELHYRSKFFKKVAGAYEFIIENHGNCPKVIRVSDFFASK
jgi:hypothetical protein